MTKTQGSTSLLEETRKLLVQQGQLAEDLRDPMLMRFLTATSMDPVKATKMVMKWAKWRQEFVPLGYIPESEILDQLDEKMAYLQGISTSGHPVLLMKSHKHVPAKDMVRYKKGLVHMLEKTIASSFGEGGEIGDEKLIVILDLDKLSYKNVSTGEMRAGFQILQSYYPGRLEKLYILNMPGFFVSIWKIISCFLEKAIQERISIVKTDNDRKNFIEEIGKRTLPKEYGGLAELVALQDITLKNYPKD
ncbi:hypothetical protein ACHQM5_011625 [Ranunculus cassubicifolius]